MKPYRYCEGCGIGFAKQQWYRSNHCTRCGSSICKEEHFYEDSGESFESPGSATLDRMIPSVAAGPLEVAVGALKHHPVLCSMGAVGAGVAGIMVAPFVMAAGQTIMVLGGVVGGVSVFAGANSGDPSFEEGVVLGVKMLGVGALVYGASYALLGAAGLSVAGGVGLGAFTGAKVIAGVVKERRRLVQGNNLMEEESRMELKLLEEGKD